MVYAVCYYPKSRHEEFKALGFDDSKKLTDEKREALAKVIESNLDWVGWVVNVLAPQDISRHMLRRPAYNLNEQAHDATIALISQVLDNKFNVTDIYVDPVGPSQSYKQKLTRYFPGIAITIEPHADALYPSVSAASICAKVTRDQILRHWIWLEPGLEGTLSKEFGSGYPSDPNTVRWLDKHMDPSFGYPSIVRFSWGTIAKRVDSIEWSEDEDEKEEKEKKKNKRKQQQQQQQQQTAEERSPPSPAHSRGRIYKAICLESVNVGK
ncbi:ribonuclease H-like domain-containing protein [Syncephalastrum racemosum]|uniref:Ribonuclease n=1 Tax=Syncephalastrum racemosum TaxID=13706 RepID=A0A1X2HII2_SYNRA|nr:ribonuclease H-like domain-containing protein [Syncephalastrum racemosum]